MVRKSAGFRIAGVAFAFFSCATATLFAGPAISYNPEAGGVRLVRKVDIGGDVAGHISVKAKGAAAVAEHHGNMTGVLFQATARPSNSVSPLPIDLSYTLKGRPTGSGNTTPIRRRRA